ncbi:hypothetical protein J6V86_03625 [bacterium]|nr:hypothetical protein [bacterium]
MSILISSSDTNSPSSNCTFPSGSTSLLSNSTSSLSKTISSLFSTSSLPHSYSMEMSKSFTLLSSHTNS